MSDLTDRLRAVREGLSSGLVERDVAVRLALLAALAGEHLLLIGPPGTAKSLIARRLSAALSSGDYFERLLTRFSVPEELFGPLSIKGLEQDRYERLTESYLPQASVAFLDEIFKANSAILNALLTLLNEREFDNGAVRVKTPLVAVVGASNELPEGEELDALFDRFLIRVHVGPVSTAGFPALLGLRGQPEAQVPPDLRLNTHELAEIRQRAETVELPGDVLRLLESLREWCAAEQLFVSDRRWRKIVKLLQVSALSNGREQVSVWDCWLLQHCVWSRPEEREKVFDWYAARVGAAQAMNPEQLTRVVVRWEAQLKRDQESRSQAQNAKGQLLYLKPSGETTTEAEGEVPLFREKNPLYLAPSDAAEADPHYGGVDQIEDRTNQGQGYTIAQLDDSVRVHARRNWQHFSRWSERETYLANPNNRLVGTGQYPAKIEPARFKAIYVEGCLSQIQTLHAEVLDYRETLQGHIAGLESTLRSHLWVTENFVTPAARSLNQTYEVVEALLARLDRVRRELELLPYELPLKVEPEDA